MSIVLKERWLSERCNFTNKEVDSILDRAERAEAESARLKSELIELKEKYRYALMALGSSLNSHNQGTSNQCTTLSTKKA